MIQLLQKLIKAAHVLRQHAAAQRAARIEHLFRKRDPLRRRHPAHHIADFNQDVAHPPKIPRRVHRPDSELLQIILHFRICQTLEAFPERRSRKRAFDAHVRKNSERGAGLFQIGTRILRMWSRHLQSFAEIHKILRRTVRRHRQDIRRIRHLFRAHAEHAHVVRGNLRRRRKLRSRRRRQVHHRRNRGVDLLR